MALVLYLLGKAHNNSTVPTTSMHQGKERKRLHKPPPVRKLAGTRNRNLYSCKEILDVVRAQSCLILEQGADDDALTHQPGALQRTESSHAHVGYLLKSPYSLRNRHSNHSDDSLSHYSGDDMDDGGGVPLRRRCKTPVLFVGQLESRSRGHLHSDPTKSLADQYRAELPPRVFTPSIEPQIQQAKSPRRRLRKIKCQLSLRDLIKEHANSFSHSDCETLCGSESPGSATSPTSPTKSYFEVKQLNLVDKPPRRMFTPDLQVPPGLNDDIALQMVSELLTNELCSALFKHHPREKGDRASSLQILLMIEAYENLQQQVRRDGYESHLARHAGDGHVEEVDGILDHWLDVLYAMYDRSQQEKGACEKIEEVEEIEAIEEEAWPLRPSFDSQATYVGGWE